MFPDKPGGISLYAHEGWRSRFNLFGPIAAFGYWIGWSVVLSFVGNIVGALIVAEWFPKSGDGVDDAYFNLGFADFGLAQAIAIVVILAVWLFNVLGVKPSLTVGYVTGALLMVPLAIFIVFPYFTGDWQSSNLEYVHNSGGFSDLRIALMWLFIMCWSAYGVEVAASFAPEYHDTKRDTAKALEDRGGVLAVRVPLPPARARRCRGVDRGLRQLLRGGPGGDRGSRTRGIRRDLSDREPDPRDEHVDRGRRPGALRHRARRHDDQVALPPEQVPRPRPGDDGRHGGQHRPAAAAGREQLRDPLHLEHRLRVLSRPRAHRIPAPAAGTARTGRDRSRRDR